MSPPSMRERELTWTTGPVDQRLGVRSRFVAELMLALWLPERAHALLTFFVRSRREGNVAA